MKGTLRFAVMALAVFILAGCVTPINWQARVGVYTYDQAVTDYGPPDRSAKLSDGTTVAQWMTDRGEVIVTPQPYVYGPADYGPVGYSTTYFPAQYLQLTFSADGKLKAWKRISK
jgi:hypothetical protein